MENTSTIRYSISRHSVQGMHVAMSEKEIIVKFVVSIPGDGDGMHIADAMPTPSALRPRKVVRAF